MFTRSNLEAHISNIKNNRKKHISDSESRHPEDFIVLRKVFICTSNIHAQSDVVVSQVDPLSWIQLWGSA